MGASFSLSLCRSNRIDMEKGSSPTSHVYTDTAVRRLLPWVLCCINVARVISDKKSCPKVVVDCTVSSSDEHEGGLVSCLIIKGSLIVSLHLCRYISGVFPFFIISLKYHRWGPERENYSRWQIYISYGSLVSRMWIIETDPMRLIAFEKQHKSPENDR